MRKAAVATQWRVLGREKLWEWGPAPSQGCPRRDI